MTINRFAAFTAGVLASACASPAVAQYDFDYFTSSPATFGKALNLEYRNAPRSKPMMFTLSLNRGPTPLKSLFGSTDPRSLEVGIDLLPLWLLIATTSTGDGVIPVLVPTTASLQGVHLHLQLMTGGGPGPYIVDKLSNKIVIVAGAARTTTTIRARLGDGRSPHGPGRGMMAVFPIPNSKGKYLLAGGGTGNILGAKGLQTTEIYDTRTNRITPGPNLRAPRALATATVLPNGKVLLAGGVDTLGNPTATCEIYDPASNTFKATGSMGTRRAGHAASLLGNGRVLVVAGARDLADVAKAITGLLRSAELYNPATGTWSSTASISNSVLGPSLTTLANGKALVAGGAKVNTLFGIPLSVTSVKTCQIYDPATGRWSSTGSMRQSRAVHEFNTIRLKDGRVLITGGVYVDIRPLIPPPSNFAGATAVKTCEYYNPSTGSWVALPNMSVARSGHTVNQMPDGRVLIAGGASGAIDVAISQRSIQEFNPASNTFVAIYNMDTARSTHGSLVAPNGSLVLFGGTISAAATLTLDSIELVHR